MLNNINYNLVLIGNPKLPHMCFFTEQSSKTLYKARQTIQSPETIYKTSKRPDKTFKILDKDLKYLTRVATHINFTYDVKYLISKTTYLNKKVLLLKKGYYIGPYRGIILPCLFPCGGPSWAIVLFLLPPWCLYRRETRRPAPEAAGPLGASPTSPRSRQRAR